MNKFLAQAGVASRRQADCLVQEGRVRINGQLVTRLGIKVDENKDRIEVDGRPISLSADQVYLLLNKPPGYIVTADDPQKRKTVMELIPRLPFRIFPVGRLDSESEGALLFTNDGVLANRLLHPRYRISKIYEVKVAGLVEDKALEKLKKGMFVDGRKTIPAKVKVIYRRKENSLLWLEIYEGRKHEIRKMFYSLGFEVKKLRRTSIAGISIKGLRLGGWRYLKPEEIKKLKKLTSISD
ncbi:MAG: pseudouridine synthase [Candidatus Saccharicenans sp.]